MLPIFEAFSVERAPVKGGTTLPCLLTVVDENEEIKAPYVVKIFRPGNSASTCREVFANVLAQQFDLKVPPAALVKVDINLINELKKIPAYAHRPMEPGYYFGTELIENALDFSGAFSKQKLEEWNPELIFAFDMLIRNVDRRQEKPNFFLHNGEPVLIDHELSLSISKSFFEYKDNNGWNFAMLESGFEKRGHVFLPYLREKKRKKQLDFGVFFEYLRVLDIDILSIYESQLAEYECFDERFVEIITYLRQVKQNEVLFNSLLHDLLR